jgi:peptidoglycan/LPS O-acetylase OafA/YrhL
MRIGIGFALRLRHCVRIGVGHLIGLLVAILIWRFVRLFVFVSDELAIYVSTDTRLDCLLFGCLLALMNWRGLSVWVFPQTRLRHGAVLGAVALLLLSFAFREEVFRSTLRYTLQGVALMPLF